MQESQRPGNTSDAGLTSNTQQPQVKHSSAGIKELAANPVIAALVTAAASLIVFTFNQVKHIDARLDELEKEARLLLTPDGTAAASREALESYYGLQAVRQRLSNLEDKLHFHETYSDN
tara:strand:+ start:46 stop:402 length:357 start_codon:yes stop_codon:yes gene_type:complete